MWPVWIRSNRPYGTSGRIEPARCSIGPVLVRACQMQACPVMTGLLAGPRKDAAGLDAADGQDVS